MTTFFVILLVLIGINAILLAISAFQNTVLKWPRIPRLPKVSQIKVYPLHWLISEYKKVT